MAAGSLPYNPYTTEIQTSGASTSKRTLLQNTHISKFFRDLSAMAREDFLNYLEEQGIVDASGMLVIPGTRHFFYDAEDLKRVKTVVNLKQLNHIREMKEFVRSISSLLPIKSNFVGCFVDNRTQNGFSDKYSNLPGNYSDKSEAYENGIESPIPFINRMYSFIDSRTNRYLTRRSVTNLLEECGLEVIGMTEMNGLTYFYTQKKKPAA